MQGAVEQRAVRTSRNREPWSDSPRPSRGRPCCRRKAGREYPPAPLVTFFPLSCARRGVPEGLACWPADIGAFRLREAEDRVDAGADHACTIVRSSMPTSDKRTNASMTSTCRGGPSTGGETISPPRLSLVGRVTRGHHPPTPPPREPRTLRREPRRGTIGPDRTDSSSRPPERVEVEKVTDQFANPSSKAAAGRVDLFGFFE